MIKIKTVECLKKIFFIAIGSYLLVFVLFHLNKLNFDLSKDESTLRATILNNIRPRSFDYLIEIYNQGKDGGRGHLKEYLNYYNKVSDYVPSQSEALGLSGFCYYYLGDKKRSLVNYSKAVELNPDFLWFYYNIGVIYFTQNQYQQAADTFYKAARTKPEENMKFILSSQRLYMPIVQKRFSDLKQLERQMQEGYLKSLRYLSLSLDAIGEKAAAQQFLLLSNALQTQYKFPNFSEHDIKIELY